MLGLAQRAGKLISGEELVIKAVQSGQARLVFLANDAGSNVTKKTTDKCKSFSVVFYFHKKIRNKKQTYKKYGMIEDA